MEIAATIIGIIAGLIVIIGGIYAFFKWLTGFRSSSSSKTIQKSHESDKEKELPIPMATQSTKRIQCTKETKLTESTPSHCYVQLADEQIDNLLEISKPRNEGYIGDYIDEQTGRDIAPYQEAINLFQEYGLMQYSGGKYAITNFGWKKVNELWELRILEALQLNVYLEDKIIADKVGLTDGQTESDELHRHLNSLENKDLVDIEKSRAGWSVRILHEGVTQRKHKIV